MNTAIALLVVILLAWMLAYRRTPLWRWATSAVVGFVAMLLVGGISAALVVLMGISAIVLVALNVQTVRRRLLSDPIYRLFVRLLPPMSDTEREALEAGTVWWDAELFAGRPEWHRLLDAPAPRLKEHEQAFIDGPLRELCELIDDWHINQERRDLPPEIWQMLKDKGFFGMIIEEAHGGLGFSAQAQSDVVSMLSTRSLAVAVTVMVPNSLGPGELLHRFGTEAQKDHYLPRLARGEEIPAFGLTGPYAGSDAASMRDTGIVCRDVYAGEEVLGIRLNWEKRYITLGPVSTVLGLAFKLHDPDHLLGDEEDRGITLALIPTDCPGVEIGRRHYPAGQAFQNGPNSGTDVFVPLDFIIGGEEGIGRGWSMLMTCLAAGRAISLPALGTAAAKFAAHTTSAYAQIRKQFNISIGRMEGVEEAIARIAGQAYVLEAARQLTNTALDSGEQPSVISAILKLEATERMRQSINDAMDVHSGKGICNGPNNLLFNGYAGIPIAITVEGANILTRSLIIFAQGSIRCHPWLLKEMHAAQNADAATGSAQFDTALCGHIAFTLGNAAGALLHNLTGARFVPAPAPSRVSHRTHSWYRHLGRASQNFALLADVTLLLLGGAVKRKQRITARFADALGELYLMSAALKRFENDGRPAGDLPFVKWAMVNGLHRIQDAFEAILQNYTSRPISWLMRLIIFPLGRRFEPVRDQLEHEMVRAILVPGEVRDRLTCGVFVPQAPHEPLRVLEDTFNDAARADGVWTQMREGEKGGRIGRGYGPQYYANAVLAGVINTDDELFIIDYEAAVRRVIDVDDFAPESFANETTLQ
ncbi:MAG: acyl-CoA dehydrogenase [Gammaproteobacteria bacterium]|jgi:acyl-CoA dehydrogenase